LGDHPGVQRLEVSARGRRQTATATSPAGCSCCWSRAIWRGEVHREWWLRVLDRYLNDAVKDYRPPRFLLNDLVRYWRTIGVAFEGKHRDTRGNDPKWVTRNAKLF
jgi:hypothetical protein